MKIRNCYFLKFIFYLISFNLFYCYNFNNWCNSFNCTFLTSSSSSFSSSNALSSSSSLKSSYENSFNICNIKLLLIVIPNNRIENQIISYLNDFKLLSSSSQNEVKMINNNINENKNLNYNNNNNEYFINQNILFNISQIYSKLKIFQNKKNLDSFVHDDINLTTVLQRLHHLFLSSIKDNYLNHSILSFSDIFIVKLISSCTTKTNS